MQELANLLNELLVETRFDVGIGETISAAAMRALYVRRQADMHYVLDRNYSAILSSQIEPPNGKIGVLDDEVRCAFRPYTNVDTNTIGFGGVALPLSDFSASLLKAASLLGPERTVRILKDWIGGKPYTCNLNATLSGVKYTRGLALGEGVRITEVPMFDGRPYPSYAAIGLEKPHAAAVGALVSIRVEAHPVFFMPVQGAAEQGAFTMIWAKGLLEDDSTDLKEAPIDAFCEAMSLSCNHCIRWRQKWSESGDSMAFGISFGLGYSRRIFPTSPEVRKVISQEHLEKARDIQVARNSRTRDEGLNTAIRWWMNTMRPESNLIDRLIGTRTALEALYLNGANAELKFRMATHGAWHLGRDLDERRSYHKALRDVYDLASKAVHGRNVEYSSKRSAILSCGQDACRKGIIKCLEEGRPTDWNDLILGA